MTLYNHITIAQKLFLTCSYRLNDITIFRATNAAKPLLLIELLLQLNNCHAS